jgi:YesN/AraC family two-component response regulator
VLLSRANPERAADPETLETNNKYLKWIEDSRTVEELAENLQVIIGRTAGNIFSFHGIRHSSALRKAERFIWENYTRKISLREIAEASGLSAPYFSTIFKEEMGENLSTYLNRIRIEKAAAILAKTNKTLGKIADECGCEDQSWFSKIFKHYMGMSPGKYRENGFAYYTG